MNHMKLQKAAIWLPPFLAVSLTLQVHKLFAQTTVPTQHSFVATEQSTAEIMARHDELVKKYGSPTSGVAIGQMSKTELDDYIAGEKLLEQRRIFGNLSMPTTVPQGDLPAPGNLASDDSAGTSAHS